MAFEIEEAQKFQSEIIERVREMERALDKEVIEYYKADRVDTEEDYHQNLKGMHHYLLAAYQNLKQMLIDIEQRTKIY